MPGHPFPLAAAAAAAAAASTPKDNNPFPFFRPPQNMMDQVTQTQQALLSMMRNAQQQQQQQHLQQQLQQQEAAPYTIDTGTAKAIIDTYSGHLFSRSTNYHSFGRGAKKGSSSAGVALAAANTVNNNTSKSKYPSSVVENLFTRDPTNFEQDSLDNSANNYYADQRNMTVVVPPNSSNVNKPNNTNTAPRVKTRTESVV